MKQRQGPGQLNARRPLPPPRAPPPGLTQSPRSLQDGGTPSQTTPTPRHRSCLSSPVTNRTSPDGPRPRPLPALQSVAPRGHSKEEEGTEKGTTLGLLGDTESSTHKRSGSTRTAVFPGPCSVPASTRATIPGRHEAPTRWNQSRTKDLHSWRLQGFGSYLSHLLGDTENLRRSGTGHEQVSYIQRSWLSFDSLLTRPPSKAAWSPYG